MSFQKPPGDDFGAFFTGGGDPSRFRTAVPTSYDFEGRMAGGQESYIPYSSGGQRYVSAAPAAAYARPPPGYEDYRRRMPRPEELVPPAIGGPRGPPPGMMGPRGPPPGYVAPPAPSLPPHPLLGTGRPAAPRAGAPRHGGGSSDPPRL